MSNQYIEFLFYALSKCKLDDILLSIKQFNKNNSNFIILAYHTTSKKAFMEHMQYLDKKYSIISYDEFYKQFSKKNYPSDLTFIITFDDGYKNFYDEIYRVCDEISIPATVFITTGNVINRNPFWWDEARDMKKMGIDINMKKLALLTSEKREFILNNIKNKVNYTHKLDIVLTKEQILEMNKNKQISFGSHTVSHTNLAVENEDNIRYELIESKKFLEKLLNKEIIHFAYPNTCYDQRIIPILHEVGYKTALTNPDLMVLKTDNFYEIPRIGGGPYGSSKYWLEARIAGTQFFIK